MIISNDDHARVAELQTQGSYLFEAALTSTKL